MLRPGQTDTLQNMALQAIDVPPRPLPSPPDKNELPALGENNIHSTMTRKMKVTGGVGRMMRGTWVKGKDNNNIDTKRNRPAVWKGSGWKTDSELE